ncbi:MULTISPECIES: WXG100 family type VII secretion target [unclassified Streptomyces]|uniref:WXG100 family type VII secretion target n=1 Tax=unclassified Streptomyces TaxID=2593676 RepID=UPI002DDA59FF|nr:WXG100 family type VII secretion target [Streptomyces sp. NBC_01750]WSA99881.1 WXG100 family type VII secretion target [Streptomyces sp. NBC_01794]WSD35687.1 WXG100 family type VII secretion target [Streptomyces sp. NBC_01750]
MSGKDLKVTSSDIGDLSGKIQHFETTLGERIRDLNRVVDLIQGGWKGAASAQYDITQAELNKKLSSVKRDLENLQNLVKMSADGFDEQERERMSSFAKMENAHTKANESAILGM